MRLSSTLAALAAAMSLAALVDPPSAKAAEAHCQDEVWSRPGLVRDLEVVCFNTDRVRIAEQPAHGIVTGDSFGGWTFHFRLATDSEAPLTDRLLLDLDGAAGTAQATVRIIN